ncbi:MAG TPA: YbhB/YbcL family Raf kinase inhibitor-like protein [Burkholderiaceae bacterium]|nr:YbhB/YbcL family Raf kinase inhibitor-like protein [Burkholderiaceae bacterium]
MLEKLPDSLGHALRHQRAGLDKTLFQRLPLRAGQGAIDVRSLAFADHAPIPTRYTADGDGCSPPLQWSGVPASAHSLVLVVEDADAPMPLPLVHAIVVNLPGGDGALAESALNPARDPESRVDLGRNSFLGAGWLPPDPPPGHGPHRYVFQLFALGDGAPFEGHPGRDAVAEVLAERAIASGCLVGTYERHDTTIQTTDAAPALVPTEPA